MVREIKSVAEVKDFLERLKSRLEKQKINTFGLFHVLEHTQRAVKAAEECRLEDLLDEVKLAGYYTSIQYHDIRQALERGMIEYMDYDMYTERIGLLLLDLNKNLAQIIREKCLKTD